MINLTIQSTIQSTIKNTLGNLSEKFITQLFVPVGSDSFITADNKIFKVRVDMSTLLYLFAEDQRGVWYDPSDLATMYQESTGGTAVTADGQPVGLMLDKSRGDLFGDELVTNGTFDTDVSGWTITNPLGSTVEQSSGRLRIVTDGVGAGASQNVLTIGKKYIVIFDYEAVLGTLKLDSIIGQLNTTQTYSAVFTASQSNLTFFRSSGVAEGYIDNVSVKEVIGIPAQQPISTQRPTYKDTPDRLEIDLVDDALLFDVPLGGIDGYMVIGTNDGTASYGVSLPAGSYDIGGDLFMGGSVNGFLLREGNVSASDLRNVEKDFVSKGAKESYGDVTNFDSYWRDKNITEFPLIDTSNGTSFVRSWDGNNLTEFPLIDTSNGTNFYAAWWDNDLTSFPLLDVSNGTNFSYAWIFNRNLTDFPANMFDNCNATNFFGAFASTNLSQASIDGILVSINSNGTSNGTFDQSGGSAPSVTGQTAIDAMRSRGWTITVTGGY